MRTRNGFVEFFEHVRVLITGWRWPNISYKLANTFDDYFLNKKMRKNSIYSDRKLPCRSVRSRKRRQTSPIRFPNACPNLEIKLSTCSSLVFFQRKKQTLTNSDWRALGWDSEAGVVMLLAKSATGFEKNFEFPGVRMAFSSDVKPNDNGPVDLLE